MARILCHSAAPWCSTGYSQQIAQLALRLKAAGHDVEISAHYGLEGAVLHWNGIRVHPGANDFGDRLLPGYMDELKPDLTLTLMDVWTLRGKPLRGRPLASWVPVDHEPLGEPIREFFRESGSRPVAMSRHGERQLYEADLAPLYVPHAIDTAVFRPLDRAEARETWNIPEQAFAVLMVATNADNGPSRKGWVEALRAFKAFREQHSDALLVLHTDLTGQHAGGGHGLNLAWLCDRIGIEPEWLHVTPPRLYEKGVPPAALAQLYSAADVLLAPSYGEGFGIPVVEAQACGTPVIVNDFSAQAELCGAGWVLDTKPFSVESRDALVELRESASLDARARGALDEVLRRWEWHDSRAYIDHYRGWWQQPLTESVVDALEEAYTEAGKLRVAAVEFAQQYDADRVFSEQWLPALAALLVRPNRQARRRAAREKALA